MRVVSPGPQVVIVAGPNGSGKSSLTRRLQRAESGVYFPERYINADEIAAQLRERGDLDPERAAFHLGREQRTSCREAGTSFAYETVFSHPSGLVDLFLLRRAGFHITLIVVTTANPEINVERVWGRVQTGGHDVPPDKIRQRYWRFHSLLPAALEVAQESRVFDATDRTRLCLRVSAGVVKRSESPPDYLRACIVDSLKQRADDRAALWPEVGAGSEPVLAEPCAGSSEGPIVKVVSTAYLQVLSDRTLVIHDRTYLEAAVEPCPRASIRYDQGVGMVDRSGPP